MCNKHGKRLLTTFLAISLCVLPMVAAAQEDLIDDQQQIQQEVTYRTDVVRMGTFTKESTFSATEYYPCSRDVVCPEEGRIFAEYAVSRGDQVKAGDVLVRLSTQRDSIALTKLQRELARLQEEFASAKAEKQDAIAQMEAAANAAADATEKEQLQIKAAIMRTQLEQFCYLQQLEIDQKQQEADACQKAQTVLELTAPIDGLVTALAQKEPEDPVNAGEVLVTLVDTGVRLLQVSDPVAELRINMPVTITVGRGNNQKTMTGTVIASEEAIGQQYRKGYAYVRIDPEFEDAALRDARVIANIVEIDNVLMVNRRAVELENGKTYVTVLANGVQQRRVILLGMSGVENAWIVAGVAEGDTLILH